MGVYQFDPEPDPHFRFFVNTEPDDKGNEPQMLRYIRKGVSFLRNKHCNPRSPISTCL